MCGTAAKPEDDGSNLSAGAVAAADDGDGPAALSASLPAVTPAWLGCAGCRYPLGGVPTGGVCPECGLAVRTSMEVLLRSSPMSWRRKVRSGLTHVAAGVLAGPIGVMIAVFGLIVYQLVRSDSLAMLFALFGFVAWLIGVLLFIEGWIRASGVDEVASRIPALNRTCRLVRAGLLVLVLTALGVLPVLILSMPAGNMTVVYGAVVCVMLAVMAHCFVSMRFVMMLAERAPDRGLYRRARVYQWLLPTLYFPGWMVVLFLPGWAAVLSVFGFFAWLVGLGLYLAIVMQARDGVGVGMPEEWLDFAGRLKNNGDGFAGVDVISPVGGSPQRERDRPGGMA